MTTGELYSKLVDRFIELTNDMMENRDPTGRKIAYRDGFMEAADLVYEMIMSEVDESWLKEGENE